MSPRQSALGMVFTNHCAYPPDASRLTQHLSLTLAMKTHQRTPESLSAYHSPCLGPLGYHFVTSVCVCGCVLCRCDWGRGEIDVICYLPCISNSLNVCTCISWFVSVCDCQTRLSDPRCYSMSWIVCVQPAVNDSARSLISKCIPHACLSISTTWM